MPYNGEFYNIFSMASLLAEYSWQFMRICAPICTSSHSQKQVSASPMLNMCSFSLIILMHVMSCNLVLMPKWGVLTPVMELSGFCRGYFMTSNPQKLRYI